MKREGPSGKVRVDHQYTIDDRRKKLPAEGSTKKANEIKEEPTTNILFLCDICKDVFNNLKLLKVSYRASQNKPFT